MHTQDELTKEFSGYVRDICAQPVTDQGNRLETIMARFADSSVRVASSSLLSLDTNLEKIADAELAEMMQRHVKFRSTHQTVRLENSAWSMMLEAAKRLRNAHD